MFWKSGSEIGVSIVVLLDTLTEMRPAEADLVVIMMAPLAATAP